jgi:hypothetical protein
MSVSLTKVFRFIYFRLSTPLAKIAFARDIKFREMAPSSTTMQNLLCCSFGENEFDKRWQERTNRGQKVTEATGFKKKPIFLVAIFQIKI